MADIAADDLRQALHAVDLPRLVSCVEGSGAPDGVLRAVRALPLGDYESVDEVVRSVATVEAGHAGGSGSSAL